MVSVFRFETAVALTLTLPMAVPSPKILIECLAAVLGILLLELITTRELSGTPGRRDPNNPAGFGTGKILLNRVYGEVVDANRDLIRLHGGGTALLKRNPPQDPYALDQDLTPTQGCVRMKNGEVNSLIQAIEALKKSVDPLEFVFIGDHPYLNGLVTNSALGGQRWQPVLRIDFGLPVVSH